MASNIVAIELDLSPVPINIRITRKDSFPYGFILNQDGSPVDLTGGAALHTVADAADGSGARFSIANTNVFDATGVILFKPSVLNLTMPPKDSYFFDVEWTTGPGDIRTVVSGKFIVCADVTNP